LYKVLFDSTNTTFNKIFDNQSNFSLVEKHNIAVQSYEQTAGVGRGTKKWKSPKGNIYLTINQNKNTDEILKNSFYVCYLIHRFFSKNYGIKFQYKWPNDLYFKDKKICGVVSTSKIIGNKSYIQTGIGFNLNSQPIKTSISLSKILNQKLPILEISSNLLKFIDGHINLHISNTYLVNYLNRYLLRRFRVNHPSFDQNNSEILKVLNDLSLRIKLHDHYENIFFGELI
jgi:BirA family biotin operon repressor/biotin-[acetyl-CoA-carboxylase] ligase